MWTIWRNTDLSTHATSWNELLTHSSVKQQRSLRLGQIQEPRLINCNKIIFAALKKKRPKRVTCRHFHCSCSRNKAPLVHIWTLCSVLQAARMGSVDFCVRVHINTVEAWEIIIRSSPLISDLLNKKQNKKCTLCLLDVRTGCKVLNSWGPHWLQWPTLFVPTETEQMWHHRKPTS